MNVIASAIAACVEPANAARPARCFFRNSEDAAALRLCTSSPICSACAISGFSSSGPSFASAAASAGASTSAIQCRRLITSGELAPKRSTLPSPSFRLENARLLPGGVLDDPHRHRRADDAGHRAHGGVVVCRREGDRSARPPGGVPSSASVGPAFEQDRADHRALHRPAHVLPRDRRAGVQDHALAPCRAVARARNADAGEHRLRGEDKPA